jgi:hypothetical protein
LVPRTRFIVIAAALFTVLAVSLVGYVVYARYLYTFPPAKAQLNPPYDDKERFGAGDMVKVSQWSTLTFTNATKVELAPGTELVIDSLGKQGEALQAMLTLKDGQITANVAPQTDRRAFFRINLSPKLTINANDAKVTASNQNDRIIVASMSGSPILSTPTVSVDIPPDQGIMLARDELLDKQKPSTWGWVSTPIYQPDGTLYSTTVVLKGKDNQTAFLVPSGESLLAPEDDYSIGIDLPNPLTIDGLHAYPGIKQSWPVTLGEVTFDVRDGSSTTPPMVLRVWTNDPNSFATVMSGSPLLVGTDAATFKVAPANAPDKSQYTDLISVLPAQRRSYPLDSLLFGGGTLTVDITGIENNRPPMTAYLYKVDPASTQNTKTLQPYATYPLNGDKTPRQLPQGEYVVELEPGYIRGRYPVSVHQGSANTLEFPIGTLSITLQDKNGNALSPRSIYVASKKEMARLSKSPEVAADIIATYRQTPYGFSLRQVNQMVVPAGEYVIYVEDFVKPALESITVLPGEDKSITITITR